MVYTPGFEIDEEIHALVSEIVTSLDRIPDSDMPPRDLRLRRENRIRSIQSSLAIEGNTLSVEKMASIADGKKIEGDRREILEVEGAISAYDMLDTLNPYSVNDLLKAHGRMMGSLVSNAGTFRDCGVGVYKGNVPIHIAPDFEDVPHLMDELMEWMESSDHHPLLKGCIFHCRFEYIHPFVDGNGRMGRLWHTLILSKWKNVFAFLPIETWIRLNQRRYYDVLTIADEGDLVPFVKYMLEMTKYAVDEYVDELAFLKKPTKEDGILTIISKDPNATARDMAKILGVSERTVKRYLSSLTGKGLIKRVGSDKTGHWERL